MMERQIFRVKYFIRLKLRRYFRDAKKYYLNIAKIFKFVSYKIKLFFESEPKSNYPKFQFSLMRLRSAAILILIALMILSFISSFPNSKKNPRVGGVTTNWTVEPEDQIGTATISNVQSNGVNGVELERYFNKTLGDVRIPYDRSLQRQQHPRVAMLADGSMYVVFHELDNDKVWLQKFNSSGVRQWIADKEAFVSSCVAPSGTTQNYTAIAEYGTDIIVVANCFSGATNQIFAQRLNSDGETQWASDTRVNDNTTRNKTGPEVVTIGTSIYIAWVDERTVAGTYEIYGQTLDSSGNRTIAGDQALVTPGVSLAGPLLNKTSSNKILLTYARTDNRNMYGRQYGSGWALEWGPTQIGLLNAALSITKGMIATTVIGDTSFHFFRANYAVNYRVWGQSLDSAGNKRWNAGADLRVGFRVLPGALSAWNDGTNPYFAATEFNAATYPCGKKVDAASGAVLWGNINTNEPQINATSIVAPHQATMNLVYNNGYNYIFISNLNGPIYREDIFYNRFDTDGNVNYASDRVVNQDFEIANQQEVYLTKDSGGNIFAVWVDNRTAALSDSIYAQLFDSNGNRLWASDTLVNTHAVGPLYFHPKSAVAGTDYYVSWEINGNIYMNKLNAAGVRQWVDVQVNQGGASVAYNPSIAYDGTNLAVVWDDNRALTGNNDIYFNSVNTAGVVQLVADQQVNVGGAASWQIESEIRSDGTDTYVVWEDNRDSSPDIYMQKVNGSGVPQYVSDVLINQNVSGSRYNPDFAMSGGDTYIVWEDTRNKVSPAADIYLAGYSGDTRIFNDVQVNQTEAQRKILPRIGVRGGHLYIVWEDYRNSVSDHDIYATSFTIGGIKRYLADTRITTQSNVLSENPAITLDDTYIGWDSDLDGSTDYNTYFCYGSDIFDTPGTMMGTGLILDTGTINVRYQTISWSATVPANTTVRFRSKTADSLAGLPAAAWSAYYTVSGENITSDDLQFIEIELNLSTTDTSVSPTVDNFVVNYLTNEHPTFPSIDINSTANRQVQFSYNLSDVDDPTAVVSFEYLYGGTWHASSNVTNIGLKNTGNTYNSIWDSTLDISSTEVVTTQIRLTGDDQYSFNNIGTGLSLPFLLDYQPPAVSTSTSPTSSRRPPTPTLSETTSPSPSYSYRPSTSITSSPSEPPGTDPWEEIKEQIDKFIHNRIIPLLAWLIALIVIITFWNYNPYVILARRRKKRKWGIVYDNKTKKPIAGALLKIVDAEKKEIKQIIKCNQNGEFSLLLPPGTFYLVVRSTDVMKIKEGPFGSDGGSYTTGREDVFYKNIYYNKEIIDTSNVEKTKSEEVQISIPVVTSDIYNSKIRSNSVWVKIITILEYIRLPLLIIGTFLALILLVTRGNIADITIFIIYLLIWIWDIYLILYTDAAIIKVFDKATKEPIQLAILRLINEKNGAIIAVEMTNIEGKASFKSIENGIYKIQAAKAGYQVYRTESQSIKTLKALGKIKIGLKSK